MTTHLDEELLAHWIIDGDVPDDAAANHLQLCTRCRESLAELRAIAGQLDALPRLEEAPADVWDRISTELGFDTRALDTAPTVLPTGQHRDRSRGSTGSDPGRRAGRPFPSQQRHANWSIRRPLAMAASVAAVLGAGAGILGTLLVTSSDPDQPATEAVARLEPLAGKSGAGNADLVQGTSGSQLRVTTSGLTRTPGFYEVWLINEDGKRMVSLGVLDPSTGGTFQVPLTITGQGYRIVDISLEPDDGNPEHSHNSVVRGTLPG
ncbi:anti-sigma factor [Kribbella sp. NPDC023972]|uniref:anti-sigma factor n=1 Tax=Kribbella sp. NPDC023972 TaxID=3154795 RepID=UPI0033C3E968